ncbi:MAG TPA: FkbM family methyltransferase [Flavobacteriaceae bacterium]|nr:FkbM family methyltransferase [Flavobacteriaceae bacterium]
MKKLINKLFGKLGYRIINLGHYQLKTQSQKELLLNNFWQILKRLDYTPRVIVDIGAHKGSWTRIAMLHYPKSQYILIEPQQELKEFFRDLTNQENVTYLPIGIGSKNEEMDFTHHDFDHSSSFIYSEEEAKKQGFSQVKIPVRSLSNLVAEKEIPIPDIVKIDAEGIDLDVLKGAENLFGKVEVILVEVAVLNNIYPNSALKVLQYMDKNGYEIFDITDMNRPLNIQPFHLPALWLMEVVFVKKDGELHTRFKDKAAEILKDYT